MYSNSNQSGSILIVVVFLMVIGSVFVGIIAELFYVQSYSADNMSDEGELEKLARDRTYDFRQNNNPGNGNGNGKWKWKWKRKRKRKLRLKIFKSRITI